MTSYSKTEFTNKYGTLGFLLLERFDGDVEEAQRALDECYLGQYSTCSGFSSNRPDVIIPELTPTDFDRDYMANELLYREDLFALTCFTVKPFREGLNRIERCDYIFKTHKPSVSSDCSSFLTSP